jgi:hypothetical protein
MLPSQVKYVLGAVCALCVVPALAFDQPQVNLGATSFLDAPPAEPGWIVQNYLQRFSADRFNDELGNQLPFPPLQDAEVTVDLAQVIYISPKRLAGGHFGVSTIVPFVLDARIDDGLNNAVLRADDGFGDITIGPFVHFDPVMRANGPRFVHRIELDFILPTGKYDRDNVINAGSNFWSFNPYWAGTFWFTPKWTGSVRAHYLYNAKNDTPNRASLGPVLGPTATSSQAGQAWHANFATEYAVLQFLRFGVNGYYLNQFKDTKVNDAAVSGRDERVFAIGPGMVFSFSPKRHLYFNAYFESGVRNRAEGNRYTLRYVHEF